MTPFWIPAISHWDPKINKAGRKEAYNSSLSLSNSCISSQWFFSEANILSCPVMVCTAENGPLPVHVMTFTTRKAWWGPHMDKGPTAVPYGPGIQGKHSKDLAPFLGEHLLNISTHGKPSTSVQASTFPGSWPEHFRVCVVTQGPQEAFSQSPHLFGLITLNNLALQIIGLGLDTGEKHSLLKVCRTSPKSSRMGLWSMSFY